MVRRSVVPFLVVTALSVSSLRAEFGVLVYDNGVPNGGNGALSQIGLDANTDGEPDPLPEMRSADDFTLDETTTIGGVTWYALESAGGIGWNGGARLEFWRNDDTDCLPDSAFTSGSFGANQPDGGTVQRTIIASPGPFGLDRVRYDVCGLSIELEHGEWFVVCAPICTFPASGQSFWETTRRASDGDDIGGCRAARQGSLFTEGEWDVAFADPDNPADLSFQLTSALPEATNCPADIAGGDGIVDSIDLLELLAQWGGDGSADIAGAGGPDGIVDSADLLALLGAWGVCPLAPGNDHPDNASFIPGDAFVPFDLGGATLSDPPLTCGGGAVDVWYCVTALCDGELHLTAPAGISIEVFEPNEANDCAGEPGSVLACSELGELVIEAQMGAHYRVRLAGEVDDAGSLQVTCIAVSGDGESCQAPLNIELDETIAGNTEQADGADFGSCGNAQLPAPDTGVAWYRITGDGTTFTADTCSGEFLDTNIAVFCGPCGALSCISGSADGDCGENPFTAETSFCTIDGASYLIAIWGSGGAEGAFELVVTSDEMTCKGATDCGSPPANDTCAGAIPIVLGETSFDTTLATSSGPDHVICGRNQDPGRTVNDIWFTFDSPQSGILTVDTCENADFDTDIVVYDSGADCASLTNADVIGCHDTNFACSGFQASINAPVIAGQTYLIRVGGFANEGIDLGAGTLTLDINAPVDLDCPPGSATEPESCLDDGSIDTTNGGCNGETEFYGTIAINGAPICGSASSFATSIGGEIDRNDTDWYLFTLGSTTTLTLHADAEFAATFGIVVGVQPCESPAFVSGSVISTLGLGDGGSATITLDAGVYAVFAAPQSGNIFNACGSALGNDYIIELDSP